MSDITDAQRAKAEELGIPIRGRMTAETLQQRIDNAMAGDDPAPAAPAAPAEPVEMDTVKIIKDGYRPASTAGMAEVKPEDLLRIGDIVDLPKDEAKHCVQNKIATRDIDGPEPEVIESFAAHDAGTA